MRLTWLTSLAGCALALALAQAAQVPPAAGPAAADWPMYRHDHAGTGYSSLTQITPANVTGLKPIWTYSLQGPASAAPAAGRGRGGAGAVNSQATPIVVAGVMYVPAANRIVAIDPENGREIWQHVVADGAPSRRGVAYWPGGNGAAARLLFTSGRRLIAIDASNGTASAGFGTNGEVDLVVPYNSVPLVFEDIVVVGANTPPGAAGGIGNARAYSARTGAKLWEFSSVPQPGTPGHETWEGDSWKGRLGANAWPFYFTVDAARGLLYIPLASPIPSPYGGDRKGANLYGNSVVAVDIRSGAYKWHFQTIHHDLWDADPPAPPSLFEVVRGTTRIPALGVTTKSGYLYVLNRETGAPIHGVEERPVPKSDVPGELAFPTQPFPVKPPPIARTAYTPTDLVTAADTSAEHAAACQALLTQLGGVHNNGPFTPWRLRAEGTTPGSTLVFPGGLGGANWGGTAFDPATGFILAATQDVGALGVMQEARAGSPVPYQKASPGRATFDVPMGDTNWPCQKPPWGRLFAVNSATGDIAWQIPLGVTDSLPPDKQRTGRPLLAGPIVTASGLVFIASTDDNRIRALDAKSGKELWVAKLERRGNANPITYATRSGKQFVVIVATDTVVAYGL